MFKHNPLSFHDKAMQAAETPAAAQARRARGDPVPEQYKPAPPADAGSGGPAFDLKTYGEGGDSGGRLAAAKGSRS